MYRVKQLTTGAYTVTENATDDDGALVAVTGQLTVKIYDGANTLLATQTPTCTNGVFSTTIAASLLPKLDTYTLVWGGTANGNAAEWRTTLEVCGGYLFEIADLRTFDRAFADTNKYPTALLRKVRTWVEQTLESPRAGNVAFVPRGRRLTMSGNSPDLNRGYYPLLYGNDYRELIVPNFFVRSLYSASINSVALTDTELAGVSIVDNVLYRSAGVQWPAWPYGKNNLTFHYTHGYEAAPGAITRAALILAREYLIQSDLPGRATATSIGDQMFRLTIAGRDGVTGIPDVDAAIQQWGRNSALVG